MKLEKLRADMRIRGLTANEIVTILHVEIKGSVGAKVTYRREDGRPPITRTVLRREESILEIVPERRFDFSAESDEFRLASDAWRIKFAHVFDPLQAVHSSPIQPLPHQIEAVYNTMLDQQPLRFLLADDPGAGKTIMAGLLVRELEIRGAVDRCLICVPGNLAYQWQEEMREKFSLEFKIFSEDTSNSIEALAANDLLIARMDQIKRNKYRKMLEQTNWDLVLIDEAHKMSAPWFGKTPNFTQRYRLGELLGRKTTNLLLLTATPHNGRQNEFQLFLRLLDPDRFSDRKSDSLGQRGIAVEHSGFSDLMRRMQKEELKNFDGSNLFPERFAYTRDFELADLGQDLYERVTNYVRNEFNRAKHLAGGRRNNVGFAMVILQRRLASSPGAIAHTLQRRHSKLRDLLVEWQSSGPAASSESTSYDDEEIEDIDDGHVQDPEQSEEEFVNNATNAANIGELQKEIDVLAELEAQAVEVRNSGIDSKWEGLEDLLNNERLLYLKDGSPRKLIIFTEFRDTLSYLVNRLVEFTGEPDTILQIHGGLPFGQRREVQDRFWTDKSVRFLVATDAAGEGINLHCTNLMINYDLPWNPNRLEQRFGRIHRIGQRKTCHLWNMLASNTREGRVFNTLIRKMGNIGGALDGKMFNVLGDVFREQSLQEIMMEAISGPENALPLPDLEHNIRMASETLSNIENRLVITTLEVPQVKKLDMHRTRTLAVSLQPWHIKAFTTRALKLYGTALRENDREIGVFALDRVPTEIREGIPESEIKPERSYKSLCFEPHRYHERIAKGVQLISIGHPLLKAIVAKVLTMNQRPLRHGAVLIDDQNLGIHPRLLIYLEQAIISGHQSAEGHPLELERSAWCVEISREREIVIPDDAPWIDYRKPAPSEIAAVERHLLEAWLEQQDEFIGCAVDALTGEKIIPRLEVISEIRKKKSARDRRVVRAHLLQEISHQDEIIERTHNREKAAILDGNQQEISLARANRSSAEERKERHKARLERRMNTLDLDSVINLGDAHVAGVALVLPAALLNDRDRADAVARREVELIAMKAVVDAEQELGNIPHDVSASKRGYDIESVPKGHGPLRLIEVKGRRADAGKVTLTRNELLTSLNCRRNDREIHILAIVRVHECGEADSPQYVINHAFSEPDPAASSVTFSLSQLLENGGPPR
ncbi:MAG: helicase-related protein [Anaerolineaceae bacterium]|nr:helicase-related protein [Anaerolineaceae bacterium]MDE0329393.1 helicase-related protein [Anaerolineaceae bacterium]